MDTKQFKSILKALKVPAPTVTGSVLRYFWVKNHGHAGAKTLSRVRENAKALGFQSASSNVSSDATGDRVARGDVLVKDGVSILFSSFYGQTAYENRFSISIDFGA
jgi:hypothetical protein